VCYKPLEAAHRRAGVELLAIQVFQQMDVEILETLDQAAPCVAFVCVGQRARRVLHSVEQIGDSHVVSLKAVTDRADRGVSSAKGGEEQHVFGTVVGMNMAAVPQAVHLQLPQRPVGLELSDGVLGSLARQPVAHVSGKLLDDFEVAPDCRMDPEKLLEERSSSLGLRAKPLDLLALVRWGVTWLQDPGSHRPPRALSEFYRVEVRVLSGA
jgi:hypothetical protein